MPKPTARALETLAITALVAPAAVKRTKPLPPAATQTSPAIPKTALGSPLPVKVFTELKAAPLLVLR